MYLLWLYNFTIYTNNVDGNIALAFLPGNHTLESQIIFTNLSSVIVVSSQFIRRNLSLSTSLITNPGQLSHEGEDKTFHPGNHTLIGMLAHIYKP